MVQRMFEAPQDEVWRQDSEGMEEWRQVAVCSCIYVFVAPKHGRIEESNTVSPRRKRTLGSILLP